MVTKNIDLGGDQEPESPEIANIKSKLKSDEDKEKAKKQMRKEQETSELLGTDKETPEVEIEEDLGQPVAAPTPVRPAVPAPPAK